MGDREEAGKVSPESGVSGVHAEPAHEQPPPLLLSRSHLFHSLIASTTIGSGIWTEYSGIKQSYYGSIPLLVQRRYTH